MNELQAVKKNRRINSGAVINDFKNAILCDESPQIKQSFLIAITIHSLLINEQSQKHSEWGIVQRATKRHARTGRTRR
jgi:hypothetical protein